MRRPTLLVLVLVLAACASPPEPPEETGPTCADDTPPVGAVSVFATGLQRDGFEGTEGIAFSPDGRLFVSGGGLDAVAEITPDGEWSHVVDVPASIGATWWGDRLIVATDDAGDGTSGVVAVDPDARTAEPLARGMVGANFVTVTPWDTLLVSAPSADTVLEVTAAGDVEPWVEGVPSPNGMVFDLDRSTVYMANTYGVPSTVTSVAVDGEAAGAVGVLATLPDFSTQDGVALGASGQLYVVDNVPANIARIAPDGTWAIVAEGVAFGASLAFGEGRFDPCSLYVTSLFTDDVFRVGVGEPGAPLLR